LKRCKARQATEGLEARSQPGAVILAEIASLRKNNPLSLPSKRAPGHLQSLYFNYG